jgi:ribosomal protein S12 methylthiotransferase
VVKKHFPDVAVHRLRHDQRSQLTPGHYAFLKIAEGCDNTCNFCAIPLIRGKHVSRPQAELVKQARTYAERGVKEISLISQHLDYYGQDLHGERRLPQLIRAIAAAAPASWIRLHYIYPNDFDDELIATIAETPNVVKYVDMPIQHGSDRMLAVMGRRTTRAHITARLDALRAAMPEVVLRSTFITGFPGEREQDVDALIDFLREQRFDAVGCFPYSDEEGTTAAKMPHKVPAKTIAARHRRVMAEQKRDFGVFACRHAGQAHEVDPVTMVAAEHLTVGDWATVRIAGVDGYDLRGTVVGA